MVASAQNTAPDTRQRILQAALEAFSERGFDGATTRDIAARAGVNLGLIKYYFDSKLKLWRAAVDAAFETLGRALKGGLDDGPVLDRRERTSTLIRRYVRFVAAHPEFVRLMHDEGKRGGPRMRWLVDRHVRPMYESLTAVFGDAQKRGLLPPGIAPLHWHYILAGSVGLIFHQAEECKRLTGLDPADEAMVEAHADAVVHLLLGPEENA
jgi:TetR/AcrR family transcriptional regulator